METNLFSLPIEPIDSQQIRMIGFVLVISRKGKEGDPVHFAWNNSKNMDFPDPEKKDRSVTKVLFSDNRAYVLRYSQIYCFDMNFVQFYLLVGMDFKKSFRTMFI